MKHLSPTTQCHRRCKFDLLIGPDPDVAWVLLTVVLGQTVVFTLNGRLSDIFGRRYFFIGGASLGVIGFVISGSAKNLSTVIGGVSQNILFILQRPESCSAESFFRTSLLALDKVSCRQREFCLEK